jgi:hypothetical protein
VSTKPVTYYLLTVWGAVEPELHGPYSTPGRRDVAARKFLRDDDLSVFWLDAPGRPEVGAYPAADEDEMRG